MKKFSFKKLKFLGTFLLFLIIIVLYVKESGSQFFIQNYKGTMLGDSTHWNVRLPCLSCHVLHGAPGAQLTAVNGNANLCISCHNSGGGMASNTPFSNADRAEPGVSGTSHAWNKNAINNKYGANFPTNYQMAGKVMSGEIVCSTCHQPHDQFYQPFLRTSNDQDAMCKNCHAVRDIGCYADDTINKGSHPVGKVYSVADSRFNATPLDPSIILINTKVECSSCHGVHYTTSGNANGGTGDGYLLRTSNDDNLCTGCHTYTSHQGMGCTRCHQSHNPNRANIYMIRDTVETAVSGLKPVMFLSDTGIYSFADGYGIYNGICEVCHTQTDHFRNDGSAPDQNHDNMGGKGGTDCLVCHMHNNEFNSSHTFPLAGNGCEECHGHDQGWEYSPGLYSQGSGSTHSHSTHTENDADDLKGPFIACVYCHDINEFPFFNSGTDGNGDNKYNLAETDVCNTCHSPDGSIDGVDDLVVGAKNNWVDSLYIIGNGLASGKEQWCACCHDDGTSLINGIYAPDINQTYSSGHGRPGADIGCLDCHDVNNPHIDGVERTFAFNSTDYTPSNSGVSYASGYRLGYISGNVPLMIPANYGITFGYNPQMIKDNASRLCFNCHDASKILDDTPGNGITSNFKASLPNPPRNYSYAWGSGADVNEHVSHTMNYIGPFWDCDWDNATTGTGGSNGNDCLMLCSSCHNVHGCTSLMGSTNEVMIRDGNLIGRTGYGFSYVVEDAGNGGYPWVTSSGATQSNSIGAIFRNNTDNMCGGTMCHGTPTPPSASSYDASGSGWGTFIEYYRPYTKY